MPDDAHEKREALKECGDVFRQFGEAVTTFVNEVRGELEFYPRYWKELLPGNQHALIVVSQTRSLDLVFVVTMLLWVLLHFLCF